VPLVICPEPGDQCGQLASSLQPALLCQDAVCSYATPLTPFSSSRTVRHASDSCQHSCTAAPLKPLTAAAASPSSSPPTEPLCLPLPLLLTPVLQAAPQGWSAVLQCWWSGRLARLAPDTLTSAHYGFSRSSSSFHGSRQWRANASHDVWHSMEEGPHHSTGGTGSTSWFQRCARGACVVVVVVCVCGGGGAHRSTALAVSQIGQQNSLKLREKSQAMGVGVLYVGSAPEVVRCCVILLLH
jgi:hypothetical protein